MSGTTSGLETLAVLDWDATTRVRSCLGYGPTAEMRALWRDRAALLEAGLPWEEVRPLSPVAAFLAQRGLPKERAA